MTTKKAIEDKEIITDSEQSKETATNIQEDKVEKEQPIAREVGLNDNVLVMNNTLGMLVMHSEVTNRTWKIAEYGKTHRMQVSDIIDICSNQSVIFEDGWAIILDSDVVEYMGFSEVYKSIIKPKEMDRFLELSEEKEEEIISKMPEGIKLTLARYIKQKINGKDKIMDSASKRQFFQKVLNVVFD